MVRKTACDPDPGESAGDPARTRADVRCMVSPPVSHFIVVVTIVLILKVFQPVSLTQAGGNKCAFRSGCVCMSMLRLQRVLDGIHGFQLGFAICRSAWQHGCSFCLDVVVETLRRFMPDSVCAVLLILLFEGALLNWVGSQRSCRSPVHRGGGGGGQRGADGDG